MKRFYIYLILGTAASFIFSYCILGSQGWQKDLYYAFAFGLAWALAYLVDRPEWPLSKKMGISFIGIAAMLAIGLMLFDLDSAVPAVIKFCTVFAAYYLLASFRPGKSLRR